MKGLAVGPKRGSDPSATPLALPVHVMYRQRTSALPVPQEKRFGAVFYQSPQFGFILILTFWAEVFDCDK